MKQSIAQFMALHQGDEVYGRDRRHYGTVVLRENGDGNPIIIQCGEKCTGCDPEKFIDISAFGA